MTLYWVCNQQTVMKQWRIWLPFFFLDINTDVMTDVWENNWMSVETNKYVYKHLPWNVRKKKKTWFNLRGGWYLTLLLQGLWADLPSRRTINISHKAFSTLTSLTLFENPVDFTYTGSHLLGTMMRRVTLQWCNTDPILAEFTFRTTPIYYAIKSAAQSLRPRMRGADRITGQEKCIGRWFVPQIHWLQRDKWQTHLSSPLFFLL